MATSTAKKDTRSKENLIAEIDRLRNGSLIEQVGLSARTLMTVICVCFVAWCGKEVVVSLAGRETNANILVNVLGSIEVSVAVAWGAAAGGVLYGLAQRRQRRATVRRLASRNAVLEQRLDPNRTSSELTSSGDTNPEDA